MTPIRPSLALAATALSLATASPASAVEVDVFFGVDLFEPFDLTSVATGEELDSETVVLDLDPAGFNLDPSVNGPGSATQFGTVTGTITNTLDEAVSGLIPLSVGNSFAAVLDTPAEVANGTVSATLLFGDVEVDAIEGFLFDEFFPPDGITAASFGCASFPCSFSLEEGRLRDNPFTLAPGQTATVTLTAEAAAIAAIPLPAAAGPATLALAACAWLGRRRSRRPA